MGKIRKQPLVKLFFAVTYNINTNIEEFYKKTQVDFHSISRYSPLIDFTKFTSYYNEEMGDKLNKQIIGFSDPRGIENLHRIKVLTNYIEETYTENNKRKINIDPGYLTEAKVVLYSTKNNIHRIYIADGIFAEITLKYSNKKQSYEANPMTYPDYQQKEIINFFNELRTELRKNPVFIESKEIPDDSF